MTCSRVSLTRVAVNRIRLSLIGKQNVDETGKGLDFWEVLSLVDKVPLATLVLGIPQQDLELGLVSRRTAVSQQRVVLGWVAKAWDSRPPMRAFAEIVLAG
jgi:hypothetical protein